MKRKENYHTKQKDMILDVIKKENGRFMVNDIYKKISGVGLTTVYRYINALVDMGKLKKEIDNNNQVYYYYLSDCECEYHLYLKCLECGKIIHIDCDFVYELYDHIVKKHKFMPNTKNLVIDGICKQCKRVN